MTLTIEELKYGAEVGDLGIEAVRAVCAEALANREAQPVAYTEQCEISNMQAMGLYLRGFPNNSQGRNIPLYTAPPAPAESLPVAWSGWACQYPGHMPRLYGDKAIAEVNCDYDGGMRLLFLSSAPPAPANACPVAWEMRYWNSGHNMWGDWERISEGLYTRLSAEHAADNDYEFRVLYDSPPSRLPRGGNR